MVPTPLKTHGGKGRLAGWVVDHFPLGYAGLDYLEPFCGGASVFFRKDRGGVERLNDADPATVAVWRAVRDEPGRLAAALAPIPYAPESFARYLANPAVEGFDLAVREFVLRRMSRGGAREAFAWSDRERGGMPGDRHAWLSAVASLGAVSARLQRVVITNDDFREAVAACDRPGVLMYIDPPYLPSTRVSPQVYAHELTVGDHVDLLKLCRASRARVVLSGYPSGLYAEMLPGWFRASKALANNASQVAEKPTVTECLWINF